MLLQYASDLHLEFPRNKAFLGPEPLEPKADLLILAGDIVPFASLERQEDFFSYISEHFEQTYWLPGNHEYYHSDISQRSGKVQEEIRNNVHLVNNMALEIKGIRLVFSTLWTRISKSRRPLIENGLTDFRWITHQGMPYTAEVFNSLHLEGMKSIREELRTPYDGKTVVITHHVPTFQHYPPKYQDSPINEGFAVELGYWIADHGPDCWIYGHHHHNSPEFKIGKTRMLTNQLGYVERNEHKGFEKGKVLELT
jgi:predicted phosphohydrolase